MQAGSDNGDPITDINVTPLVDVSLVLVIIFMAVAPFTMQAGIKAADSKAGAAKGKTAEGENVSLDLASDGTVKMNGKIINREILPAALEKAIGQSKDGLVSLSADKAAQVGQVVEILDLSKQKGAKKLAIIRKEEVDSPQSAVVSQRGGKNNAGGR